MYIVIIDAIGISITNTINLIFDKNQDGRSKKSQHDSSLSMKNILAT